MVDAKAWAERFLAALGSSRRPTGQLRAMERELRSLIAALTPPPNLAPSITVDGPTTAVAGETVTFVAVTSDPEGTPVYVDWLVDGVTVLRGPSLVWTASEGMHTIRAWATDGTGLTTLASPIEINVTAPLVPLPGLPTGFAPGPKAVVPETPAGAVTITPDQSLPAAVAAGAPGTVFILSPGVHTVASEIRPKAGMRFVGHGPTTILDCEGRTMSPFIADWQYTPGGVVLENFVLRNAKQPSSPVSSGRLTATRAAIQALDTVQYETPYAPGRDPSGGWTLRDLLVTGCTAAAFLGSGGRAIDCAFVNNDQIGLKMWGDDIAAIRCDLSRNNVDLRYDTFYEAGGMKSWKGDRHVTDGCRANDCGGSGIWYDYTGTDGLIQSCEAIGNTGPGIAVETSTGTIVRYCKIAANDGDMQGNGVDWYNGGIFVYSSPNVRIESNLIDGGVIFQSQDRGLTGWGATPNGSNAASNGDVQTGTYGARVVGNTISTSGGQWTGERVMVQTDYPPYVVISPSRAREIVADMQWIGNTYVPETVFGYARVDEVDSNIWTAVRRWWTDAIGWAGLGRN